MEGKASELFLIKQGLAQDCTLSPTLFLIYMYINSLLHEIEKHSELHVGVKFSETTMSSLLFANDFVGIVETRSALEKFARYCT